MSRSRGDEPSPTITGALGVLRVDELKAMAAFVVSGPLPSRKGELAALLNERLAREDCLRDLWGHLGELERAAVSEVVHGESRWLDHSRFRAKYGALPDDASGLSLFLCYGVMPDDLRERLRGFVPPPPRAALATRDELPEAGELGPLMVLATECAALHELRAVLRLVESGRVPVSDRTRRPTAGGVRAVAAVLQGNEPCFDETPIRAFAWPMLVQAAGLAQLHGSRLGLTRAGSRALTANPAEVIRTVWERWLDSKILDELSRIEVIKGQNGKGKRGLTAVTTRRHAIADAVAECPIGRWVAVDELFRYMRAAGHDFEVARDRWRLYITSLDYGSLGYDGYGGWNILQARYALCVLFEYAATLGLIDVAYVPPHGARPDYFGQWGTDHLEYLSRYDGLTHIRLTALGEYALGVADVYEPPREEPHRAFVIQSNLDVVATDAMLSDQLTLERYAQRTGDRTWKLDRDMLLTAVEQDDSVAVARQFLEVHAATALPPAVVDLLSDVEQRTQRFVDRGLMRVIDCTDPALVAQLAHDAKTRGLCIAAGENRLLVPNDQVPAFRRALRGLGYAVRGLGYGPTPGDQVRKAA
jgi:hypothetical protein